MGASTDRGSAHNAPRICGDFLRVLGALTSPPVSDGTRLTCVLELSAGERCASLVRPCAGRLGQDAPAAVRDPSIEKYSRSCRAWAGTATENPAPLNAARRRMLRIDGGRSGTARPFSAVAPPQRPVCNAHRSKIFGSGIPIMSPRARTSERSTSSRFVSSARTSAFCQPDPHCLASVARLPHIAR